MTRILLLICAILFVVPMSHAANFEMDGNQLQSDCKNSEPVSRYSEGACISFVMGTLAGYTVANVWSGAKPSICMPKGVSNGQNVKVVVKYLNDHPERLQIDAAVLALRALSEAFPCPVEPAKHQPTKK